MRILIANDDGYLAPGIAALVEACQGLGEIDVVAPERNASGTSNALTLDRPLQVFDARGGAQAGFRFVNGTPSDCVHVALTGLLDGDGFFNRPAVAATLGNTTGVTGGIAVT